MKFSDIVPTEFLNAKHFLYISNPDTGYYCNLITIHSCNLITIHSSL